MKKIKFFPPKERKQHKKYKVVHKQKKITYKKENKTVRAHRLTQPAVVVRRIFFRIQTFASRVFTVFTVFVEVF